MFTGRRRSVFVSVAVVFGLVVGALPAWAEEPSGVGALSPAGQLDGPVGGGDVSVDSVSVSGSGGLPRDEAAAMALARSSGMPVVVETLEGESAETVANPDGTFTTALYTGPVRMADGGGGWLPLDPTLVAGADGVRPKGSPADMVFSDGGSGPLAVLSSGGRQVSFSWDGGDLPTPVIDGRVVRYPGVVPGVDLELEAHADGYAKRFVVHERPEGRLSLPFTISTVGLDLASDASGQLSLKDSSGVLVGLGEAPRMWGATFDPHSDEPTRQAAVPFEMERVKAGWRFVLSPDPAFFDDPAVAYPVVIDPSSSLTVSSDTWVQSDSTVSKWTNTELRAGTFDGGSTKARSLLLFDVSSLNGKQILSASLNLWEFHSWSCTAREVRVYRLTAAFSSSTLWSNQPGTGAMAGSANVATGYSASCPDGWIGIPVTPLIQQWTDGTYPNYGMRVMAADETDNYGWKKFNSYDAGTNVPYLSVTWNTKPPAPSSLSPANGAVVATVTPTLSAYVSDPDGNQIMPRWQVYQGSACSGSPVWQAESGWTNSGTTPSIAVPGGVMSSQTQYAWRVASNDGNSGLIWSGCRTILPDTTAPAAPSVSSSTHPSQSTWYANNAPAVSWSASDTSGIGGYSYVLDQTSTTTPDTTSEGTGTSVSYSGKANGVWYFHVRAKDGAGNWGSTRHFTIRVDKAAPSMPVVASSSHPDENAWYASDDPVLSWTASTDSHSGVAGYSYALDAVSNTTPDTTIDGTGTTKSYTDIAAGGSGVFYFHIRAKDNAGNWSATDHYTIRVDAGGAAFTEPSGDETTLQGTVTLEAVTGPNATSVQFQYTTGNGTWTTVGIDSTSTPGPSSGQQLWSVPWNTSAITTGDPVPFQVRAIPSFPGGAGQAVSGPVGTIDPNRLGVNSWWTFEEIGGGAQVNLATGNVIVSATDLSIPAPGGAVAFTRTYNSQGAAYLGSLGWGWEFSLPSETAPAAFTAITRVTSGGDFVQVDSVTGEPLFFLNTAGYASPVWEVEAGFEGMTLEAITHAGNPAWKVSDIDGTAYVFERVADNTAGKLLQTTPPGSGSATVYGYNGSGQLVSVTTPTGDQITIGWTGSLITSIDVSTDGAAEEFTFAYSNSHLTGVTDVRTGLTWTYGYNQTSHRITSITPPGQTAFTLDYTGNKLTQVSRPAPGGGSAVTGIGYDPTLGSWTEGMRTTLTTPRGHSWVYDFDTSSRVRFVRPPTGAARETTWNAANQVVTSQSEAEAAAGDHTANTYSSDTTACNLSGVAGANDGTDLCSTTGPAQVVDGQGMVRPVTSYEYDNPAGLATAGVYHLVTKQTNPDGTYVLYTYTANGLAVRKPSTQVTKSAGGATLETRSFTYDAYGNTLTETDPAGNVTTFVYTTAGLVQQMSRPGTPTRSYTYNLWGSVLTETWPGSVTTNTYDTAGRLSTSQATSTVGLAAVPVKTTHYRPSDGLIDWVSDSSGTVSYTYDSWGRILTETDALGETTTFGYDFDSNLVSRSDSKGTTTFGIDSLGRTTLIVDSGVGTTTVSYGASGGALTSTTTYPNGVTAVAVSRVGSGDVDTVTYANGSGTLGVFDRDYDVSGQVVRDVQPDVVREYDYDDRGRLIEARDFDPATSLLTETRAYVFDVNTNRTQLTTTPAGGASAVVSYVVDAGSDRVTGIVGGSGAGSFSYDVNGNTIVMPSRTVSWTAQNRIDQITTTGGVSVVYGLDPLGRTLTRTTTASGVSKSASHHCAADADSPSWTVDVDGGVTTVSRYVNAGGGLVATQVMGGGVSFPLFTPHGDVWASTDGSGNVTATFSYDEYGNPLQVATGDEGVDRYGWLGRQQREWDPEVGITLMGVRGYDPTLGRFLSVDPVYGGSANAYDYVAGDPINGYDLDGHAGFWNKIKKTAKRARAWIRSRDFGTAAAGVFNIAYGNLRMVSGAATVVASVGLLGTPFAPLGIAGIVVGGSSGFLGAARTVRGATQVARVLRAPCVSRCGFSGHVSRFVRGILPNFSGTWLDKLGGF